MEDELDLVVFEDDEGNQLTMEVLDYFFYEGDEYALLADHEEDDACDSCDKDACDGCELQRDAIVMKVVPVGEDEEEFVPVDDELAKKLMEIVQNEYDLEDEAFEDEQDEDDDK